MSNQEIIELDNLIEKAKEISAAMLLDQKKKLGQKMVISENGIIRIIVPKDISLFLILTNSIRSAQRM